MYYLSLPKDIYISDTPPSDGSTLFWLKTQPKRTFIAKGPRVLDKQVSADYYLNRISGLDLLSVYQFDEAPEVLVYDQLVKSWTSFAGTSGGDLIPSCLSYRLTDGHVYITKCDSSAAGKLVIPSTIDGFPVVGIDDYVFDYCTNITELILPNSIKNLSSSCYWYLPNLEKLILPENMDITYFHKHMLTIGKNAFNTYLGCSYLGTENNPYYYCVGYDETSAESSSFVIHPDCRFICGYAFESHQVLCSIDLPSNLTTIGEGAFYDCSNLDNIDLPASVTSLGSMAFACSGLCTLTIPDSITHIDEYLLSGCESLSSILIGSGVTAGLEDLDTSNNPNLESIYISDNNPAYTSDLYGVVFNKAKTLLLKAPPMLSHYTVPTSVLEIGANAFHGSPSLTEITLTNVKKIGDAAFGYCTNLTTVHLSSTLTTISSDAFSGSGITEISLPDTVISIESRAFAYTPLTSVTFGSGLSSLPEYCFESCDKLTEVEIPSCITTLNNGAFRNCRSLAKIILPDSLSFADGPFGFSYVDTSIVHAAIQTNNCTQYNGCYYLGSTENPYMILLKASSTLTSTNIHENTKFIDAYAFYKCTQLQTVTIPNELITMGTGAFSNCSSLTSVTLPSSLRVIGTNAFNQCRALANIEIPEGVEQIGGMAIYGTKITSIVLPNSVTSLGHQAISCNNSLTSVTLSSGLTSTGPSAFYANKALTTVVIPEGISVISSSSFGACSSLASITLPNSVRLIENRAFYACTSLVTVSIPEGVEEISGAFQDCTNLSTVSLPTSLLRITGSAFENAAIRSIILPGNLVSISSRTFYNCKNLTLIRAAFDKNTPPASTAPWGATRATIYYNCV